MTDVPLGLWLLLGGLLALSAACSAAESALFSLGKSGAPRAGSSARALLERPRDVLIALLLINDLVNLSFFLFAQNLLPGDGGRGDLAVGLSTLVSMIVLGEVLPKVGALRANVAVARATAPALLALVARMGSLRHWIAKAMDACFRALGPIARDERGLDSSELGQLLERSAEQGLLHDHEADLLYEIVELRAVRVREIMQPRVDALFLDVRGAERAAIVRQAVERRLAWLPLVDGTPDRVLGRVRLRDLLVHPERPLRQLSLPVKFVPEVASALDLLHTLREERAAEAVVVDEWGGTAGVVDIENVFEEIVGDLRQEGEARGQSVVPLGEGRFRVDGGLSLRDWNDYFGYRVVPNEFETVGGFVTALLGRIPRPGDEVHHGELSMRVHAVAGRRVAAVDMSIARAEAEA